MRYQSRIKNKRAGFTLIELLVALSLFVFMVMLILPSSRPYQRRTVLEDMTYRIALAIRQTQNYAFFTKANTTAAGVTTFDLGYGIAIKKYQPEGSGTEMMSYYIIFADTDKNKQMTGNYMTGDPWEEKMVLNGDVKIDLICALRVSGVKECSSTWAYVTFLLPDIDAYLFTPSGSGPNLATQISLRLESGGEYRYVNISQFGQISVSSTDPF